MAKKKQAKKEVEFISVRSPKKSRVGKPPIELKPVWVFLVFAIIIGAFFSSHLGGSAFLWEDFTEQFLPFETFAARSFADGIIPFWNPYTFCGMPFFADLQNGFFYPGHQLMYLLSGGELSVWLAQFIIILHYFIAMVGMWKLARGLEVGEWGSVFAGISYGLSGMLVAHMIHPNMLYHMAFFPLIVYFFYKGVAGRSWLHTLLAGLTLGLVMLSGHPQMALYIIFFLFCLTIFLVIRDFTSKDPERKNSIVFSLVRAALPIIIGAGIFAVQYLPSQELADLSQRATMTYEKSLEGSLGSGQLFTLVLPKFFGVVSADTPRELPFWYRPESWYFWETVIYFGVVTLLLAFVGLASRRLGNLGWFLGGMGLLGLLYALGDSFIIHPILAKLPFFDVFRIPTRLAIYLTLAASLLGGVGLERVIRSEEQNSRLARVVMIAGGIIVFIGILAVSGTLAGMFNAPQQIAAAASSTGIGAVLIGGLASVIAWFGLKRKAPGTGTGIALILLCAIDLFIFGVDQNKAPTNPESVYQAIERSPYGEIFRANPPNDLFRVRMREGGAMLMQRNQGPYSRYMLFEGYNPLLLERLIPPVSTPDVAYDLMNVRYTIAFQQGNPQPGVAERTTQYPHARMIYNAQQGTTEEIMAKMKAEDIDYSRTALLEQDPGIPLTGSGNGTATISAYDLNDLAVDVKTDVPGLLVLSEIWYPAWKAYIDGKPAELLPVNYSMRGVAVPAGEHKVELHFESDAVATGSWITLVTLIGTLAGIIALWVLRGRKKGGAESDTKGMATAEAA